MSQNICNICGANYEYRNGRWICPACGAYKAEELSNEEVTLLYNAAQKLRLSDFDEAEKAYADIITKYPQNSEGYWGRLLARFGIKYEEDFDGKQIPTCYATIESIMSDKDYAKAVSLADEDTKAYYIKQAEYIERVRKEWVEKARKEKPYDIFISYKDSDAQNGIERTKDSIAAQDLYIHLTGKGYRVFFSRESLRDKVGEKYEPYIFNALSTAKVMIVYGSSSEYITSTWVKNEWMRYEKKVQAGEKKKNSLIVACDSFSPAELPKVLSSMQCLDATKRSFYEDLDNAIDKIIKVEEKPKEQTIDKKPTKKLPIALGLAAALVAIVLCILIPNLTNQEITNLTNSYYGISVEADRDTFPKGTELKIEEVLSGEKYDLVQRAIGEQSESFKIYDIELDGKKNVDINGTVTVKIPLPNDMSTTGISAYYVSDKGVAEKLDCTVADGYVTFKTTHFSLYVIAEDKINNTGFDYKINSDDTVTINRYTGSETEVVIPQTIEGKTVVEIGSLAFDSLDRITSVIIPETVTTIGAKAFYGCTSITSITIPSTVTSVGTSAFYGWNNSQEIILAGRKDIPSGWNAQWNGSCNAKLTYGLIAIIFHSNGGNGTMNNQMVEINSSALVNENKFTLAGYTFAGWATTENGEIAIMDKGSFAVAKESVYHLYAVWSANENKVIFNANGGEGAMDAQNIHTNEKANLSVCTFTKDGYTFGGWATSAGGSVVYSNGGLYSMGTSAENVLYAVWVPNNNALIFNSNGGFGSMDSITIETDETITIPKNTFTLDGYTFLGWSDVQNGSVQYTDEQNFTMTSSATVTLYAVWRANENELTFNSNFGACDETSINMNTGATANLPNNTFTRNGYTFLGWSTTANGTVEYVDGASYTMGAASTTLYAVWSANDNKIVFNTNGGSGTMNAQIIKTDASANLNDCEFERVGYVFAGWATSPTGNVIYTNGASYTMGANSEYTLYAIWTIADYKINYVLGGGTNNGNNPAGYDINDSTITLGDPTRKGYTFNGWFSDETFQTPCNTISSGSTGAKTFYASWSAKENTLHFNANGGSGSMSDLKINTDASAKLTKNTFTRDGYTFKGWSTIADGSVDFNDEATYTMGSDSEYTLYAVWEIISYTINYDTDGGSISGNRTTYTAITDTFTLPKPTKFGYTFLGWSGTDVAGNQEFVTITKGSIGERSYKAHWKANDYVITLNVNGGNALDDNTLDVTFNEGFTLPTPEYRGYKFKGWYYGSTLIESGTFDDYDASITLVAQWEIINYELSYNTVGGTISGQKTEYNVNTNTFTLPTPTKTGYRFLGWSGTDVDGVQLTVTVSKNSIGARSYTANWEANTYKATFDPNGGSVTPTSKDIVFDTKLELPAPTREGYTFVYWKLDGSEYTAELWTIASNKTLVAEWTPNINTKYTVKHLLENANDSGYAVQDTETFYGTTDTTVTPNTKSYTGFNTPSKATVKILGDGSAVLEYRYTRTTRTVTFITNGGDPIDTMTVKYQQTVIMPNAEREGFTFGGWFTDVALSEQFTQTTVSSNVTLYAWWAEENKPTDFSFTGTTELTIQSYNRAESRVQIPAYIRGVPVTTIAENSFANHTTLLEIVVPSTVTTIQSSAFKGCSALERITLPFVGRSRTVFSTVGKATSSFNGGAEGFFGYIFGGFVTHDDHIVTDAVNQGQANGGTGIYVYQNYYYIPRTLKEVVITDATGVSAHAFYNCSMIESISLNNEINAIHFNAFYNCSALSKVNSNVEGECVLPTSLTQLNKQVFYNCDGIVNVNMNNTITSIGEGAFKYSANLTTVLNANNAKTINADAFYDCKKLVSFNGENKVVIPNGCEIINAKAFYGCTSITEVVIPATVKTIEEQAFAYASAVTRINCDSANTLVLLSGIESIGNGAFYALNKIEDVIVPDTVTSIGSGAFGGFDSLTKITLPFVGRSRTVFNTVPKAKSDFSGAEGFFGYIFGGFVTHDKYIETEAINQGQENGGTGTYVYQYYYYIPRTLKEVIITDATGISAHAFYNCFMIESISLNNEINAIYFNAFYDCSALSKVNSETEGECILPTSLTQINKQIFYNCDGLINVNMNNTITSIGEGAFKYASNLTTVSNASNAMTINADAFYDCKKLVSFNGENKVVIPNGCEIINAKAFYGCTSIAEVVIPKTVKTIGEMAFAYCSGITKINSEDEGNLILLTGLEVIESGAFYDVKQISELYVPDTVTVIGSGAFGHFEGLTKITIPFIGRSRTVFSTVSKATSDFKGAEGLFGYIFGGFVTHDKYIQTDAVNQGQENGGTGTYAYQYYYYIPRTLKEVVITDAAGISAHAFYNCSMIEKITFNEEVSVIYAKAFYNCSSLDKLNSDVVGEIHLGNITRIEESTFMNCNQFVSVDSSSDVTYIGAWAFGRCDALIEVDLGTSVASIGEYAFYYSEQLMYFCEGEGSTSSAANGFIGPYAFAGCVNLLRFNSNEDGEFNLPNGIKYIDTYAFYNCVNIEKLSIDATVTTIGSTAFGNCGGISLISYGGYTEENWNKISVASGNEVLSSATKNYYKGTMKLTLDLNGFSWATSGYKIAVVFVTNEGSQWVEMTKVGSLYVCNIPDGYEVSEFKFVRVQGEELIEANIKHQTNTFTTVMNTNYKLTSWSAAEKN